MDEYAEFYRNTKIVVNFTKSDAGPGFNQFLGRVTEALTAGCLLLEEANPQTRRHLIPGKHYVEWSEPEELVNLCRYFLENEQERIRIAKAGQDIALSTLSPASFWKTIFDRVS